MITQVRWQGHPHQIPHIRIASSSSTAFIPAHSSSRDAAKQVLQRPLSPALIQARSRRRYIVSSRISSHHSITRSAYRKASFRAKHRLQAFGWRSSTADQAVFPPALRHHSTVSLDVARPRQARTPHLVVKRDTTIPSFDGAAHSKTRRRRDNCSGRHSCKAELSDTIKSQAPLLTATNRHPRTIRHTRVAPRSGAQRHKVYRRNTSIDRGVAYDPRISLKLVDRDPVQALRSTSVSAAGRVRPQALSRIPQQSHSASVDKAKIAPMGRDPTNRRQSRYSSAKRKTSISLSRSPSERKSLKKFTKELERHLQATRDIPQSVSSTSHSVTVSADTVEELKPYKTQFNAAGLAVTSNQQRGLEGRADGQQMNSISPAKATRGDYQEVKNAKGEIKTMIKVERQPSDNTSGSTGTTVMGFTPPHEKVHSKHRAPTVRRQSSSDHTFLEFTPPHEKIITTASPSPKQTTRRSLPWLRKPEVHVTNSVPVGAPQAVVVTGSRGARVGVDLLERTQNDTKVASKSSFRQLDIPTIVNQETLTGGSIGTTSMNRTAYVSPHDVSRNSSSHRQPSSSAWGTYSSRRSEYIETNANAYSLPESACVPHSGIFVPDATPSQAAVRGLSPVPHQYSIHKTQRDTESSRPVQVVDTEESVYVKCSERDVRPLDSPTSVAHNQCLRQQVSSGLARSRGEPQAALSLAQDEEGGFDLPQNYSSLSSQGHRCPTRESLRCQQCFPSRQTSGAISPRQRSPTKLQNSRKSPPSHSHSFHDTHFADPGRGSSSLKRQPSKHRKVTLPCSRPLPRPALSRSRTLKSIASNLSVSTENCKRPSSNTVFGGLQVATAAACDEDIDTWIEDITGVSVRSFLGDLSKFSGLGVNALADVAQRAAKQRTGEQKAWEDLRRQKVTARNKSVGPEDEGDWPVNCPRSP